MSLPQEQPEPDTGLKIIPLGGDYCPLADRKIAEATARKFQVQFQPNEKVQHVYPYFDKQGRHVANKLRFQGPKKDFVCQGLWKEATLFGQQLWPPGSAKALTLVEGECDALAASEMQGNRFPTVSVKNGASGAVRDCVDNFEYLNSFETIVICFDKDEPKVNPATGEVRYPGQEAALTCAGLFPLGKVRILTLQDGKDPNDYLASGKTRQFMEEWWKAPVFTPTGLKLGKDMWEEIRKPKQFNSIPYPWDALNKMTYGIRLSELVLLTGDTGDGKTSIVKEIEYYILKNTVKSVGLLHLEEPNEDTGMSLMSIEANKPLHLPDVREGVTDEELRKYYDAIVNTERVVIWDHFGSNSIHEVLGKIRHMAALGCKYIVLDHLSIVVSDQSGDERKQLDEISTKLKMLCMELNIAVIAVIHLNRVGLIRGSAGPEQLANIVMKIYRNKDDIDEWRRNVSKVMIKKNRFCSRTGPGVYLHYDPMTGRLNALEKDDIEKFEAGQVKEEKW